MNSEDIQQSCDKTPSNSTTGHIQEYCERWLPGQDQKGSGMGPSNTIWLASLPRVHPKNARLLLLVADTLCLSLPGLPLGRYQTPDSSGPLACGKIPISKMMAQDTQPGTASYSGALQLFQPLPSTALPTALSIG